jgi:hypothetical protein
MLFPPEKKRKPLHLRLEESFQGHSLTTRSGMSYCKHVRSLEGWQPSYRSKWVNGHVSGWDTEWYYHLPFPFVGVEWFDIGLHEHVRSGRLIAPAIIDHSEEITSVLAKIGFDFEVRDDVARIWGYFPKSYEDFPPVTQA